MPRVVLALAATTALVATTTCVAAAATPADAFDFRDAASTDGPTPLLWLPLGDSITFGCGNSALPRQKAVCVPNAGGYRVPLAWTLAQLNYNVSTMGTLTNGGDDTPPQWHHHEGHPGWRWDQVDDILDQSLETSPTPPDLVTIHLGTNDCGQGADLPTLQNRTRSLLSHLFQKVPKASVFVASIIGFPSKAACADAYNKALPDIVGDFKAQGMAITYTPMEEWSGVCVGPDPSGSNPLSGLCCAAEVHPTAAGYLRMASAFALNIIETGLK